MAYSPGILPSIYPNILMSIDLSLLLILTVSKNPVVSVNCKCSLCRTVWRTLIISCYKNLLTVKLINRFIKKIINGVSCFLIKQVNRFLTRANKRFFIIVLKFNFQLIWLRHISSFTHENICSFISCIGIIKYLVGPYYSSPRWRYFSWYGFKRANVAC